MIAEDIERLLVELVGVRVDDAPVAFIQRRSRSCGETLPQEAFDDLGPALSVLRKGLDGRNYFPVECDGCLYLHTTIMLPSRMR